MDESETKQQKVFFNFSWWCPWVAGFLFTIAFVPTSWDFTIPWYEKVGVFVLSLAFWPAMLGAYLQKLISGL